MALDCAVATLNNVMGRAGVLGYGVDAASCNDETASSQGWFTIP
jgi:hypothetical protein